jgi:hypothetical protein
MTKISRRAFAASAALGLAAPAPQRAWSAPAGKGAVIKKCDVLPTAVEFRSTFRIGRGVVGG